jgi:hypothetical protein
VQALRRNWAGFLWAANDVADPVPDGAAADPTSRTTQRTRSGRLRQAFGILVVRQRACIGLAFPATPPHPRAGPAAPATPETTKPDTTEIRPPSVGGSVTGEKRDGGNRYGSQVQPAHSRSGRKVARRRQSRRLGKHASRVQAYEAKLFCVTDNEETRMQLYSAGRRAGAHVRHGNRRPCNLQLCLNRSLRIRLGRVHVRSSNPISLPCVAARLASRRKRSIRRQVGLSTSSCLSIHLPCF